LKHFSPKAVEVSSELLNYNTLIAGRILVTGQTGVGKTAIVRRFVYGKFDTTYTHSIGERIDFKQVVINSTSVELSILDAGKGTRDLDKLDPSYFNSAGIIHVVDGMNPSTYFNLTEEVKAFRKKAPYVPVFIAINKCDETPMDTKDFINEHVSEELIFSTSAKNGTQLEDLFMKMSEELIKRRKRNISFLNFF
jgi:small GTP-binding protein